MHSICGRFSKSNGCHRCSCCPYGYHIDVDFVHYCEALLAALYGKRCSSSSSRASSLGRSPTRQMVISAPASQEASVIQQWLWDQNLCHHHHRSNTAHRTNTNLSTEKSVDTSSPRLQPPPPPPKMINFRKLVSNNEFSSNHVDRSLSDAVALFEKVLKEHENSSPSRSYRNSSNNNSFSSQNSNHSSPTKVNGDHSDNHTKRLAVSSYSVSANHTSDSHNGSPAASLCSSFNENVPSTDCSNRFLAQVRDQLNSSLQKMKDLEDQVKNIPVLRQKVILLREERKQLMKRIRGISTLNVDDLKSERRVSELEKSGLITPPMRRRKLLFHEVHEESQSSDDDRIEPSVDNVASNRLDPILFKNVTLDAFTKYSNVSCQTDYQPVAVENKSVSTLTENHSLAEPSSEESKLRPKSSAHPQTSTSPNHNRHRLCINRLKPVSIDPKPGSNNLLRSTKSIGISTNLAPVLPRRPQPSPKNPSNETIKKALLMSRGTDPLPGNGREKSAQASVKMFDAATATESTGQRDMAIICDARKDLELRGMSRRVQTDRVVGCDRIVQVCEKCAHCELKQTETISVGCSIPMTDSAVNTETFVSPTKMTDSMLSSMNSMGSANSSYNIKLCDKCNEIITSMAKEVVKEKTPSPILGSRIPRLANPSSNVTAESCISTTNPTSATTPSFRTPHVSNNIIIEEGNNDEILVYRNPNANLSSRKHRSNFPSMMTPVIDLEGIRLLDEACKITDSDSDSASSSEATYILEDSPSSSTIRTAKKIEPSKELKAALKVLNDGLMKPDRSSKPATMKSLQIIEKEWFSIAACKESDPLIIDDYLDCFEKYSKHLLNRIVNLTDSSGNTAMHYAISHSNFDVVSVLLNSRVCDVNKQNKAGYTAIMLSSLAKITNETQKEVIRRLFSLGDVNIRATQNGQTALMLASSHGQFMTCKLLLEAGAAPNLQDNDGSTALMCATEHGHIDVVKLLLSHPDCEPTIADNDKATALSIAMECGRKNIATLLYASCNLFSRGSSPYASLRRSRSNAISSQLQRTGSLTCSMSNQGNRSYQLAPSPPTRSRRSSTASVASQKRTQVSDNKKAKK